MSFHLVKHPLIDHKMGILRDKNTSSHQFKQLVDEIAVLLAFEATRNLPISEKEIETPLEKTTVKEIFGKKLVLLPILRAGLGMVDGIKRLIPSARIGHIGLYRNEETMEPQFYFYKVSNDIEDRQVLILDPMVATGGSAIYTIRKLHENNIKNISFLCLVASPEGIANIEKEFPDLPIYGAALDRELNSNGYILPGLGDAGDRIFGTK